MAVSKINNDYLVNRTISLTNHCNRKQCEGVLHEYLKEMIGVHEVEVNYHQHSLRLVYDTSKVRFEDIEKCLMMAGYPVADTYWSRMRTAMYKFTDENAYYNAHSATHACCSQPRGINTKGR